MNPKIRLFPTHNPDDMIGQAYTPIVRSMEVTVAGSGTWEPWQIPAGTFLDEVILILVSGLDAGTIDIGDGSADDAIIDNTELDETSDGAVISSRVTTLTSGKYYSAASNLKISVGDAATEGTFILLVKYFDLSGMTFHAEETIE